jgi:very-short-patch-repair endonuclease
LTRWSNLITGRAARLPGDYGPNSEPAPRNAADATPVAQVGNHSLPGGYIQEHKFHPTRKWRFDYAWLAQRVALEVEGGAWSGGRHTRGKGYIGDMEKYNAAGLLGWLVLRVTPQQVESGEAGELVSEALAKRKPTGYRPECH